MAPEAHAHPARDVHHASSVRQMGEALSQLQARDQAVTEQLNTLIASQNQLARELSRLDLFRAQLGSQVVNVRGISNGMLSDAASTAKRISGAVRTLDQEQANVKATLEVVEQVAELKACVLGVHGSMGAPQDWETAAGYLSRASKIPAEVIDGSFAEEIVPTAEVPDPPRVTLNAAAESLCGLFLRAFEKAASDGDGATVTRFFKLFPLIGRSEVGLDAYGRYVCQGVAARARQNLNSGNAAQRREGPFYSGALTKLFEHIAHIVETHEPLVQRHYGAGNMTRVIERLQIEADTQGGILLDTWGDERMVDRKLTDVKSYPFSFLVQSFLSAPKPSLGISRSNSPFTRTGSPAARSSEDEEGVDMKEIDNLLSESGLMLGRWALYARFLANKEADRKGDDDDPSASGVLSMPPYLANSNLQRKVTKNLIEPFNVVCNFFVRRSVEKAFQLDESPTDLTLQPNKPIGSNPPYITSAVDDVMYIVNKVLQRCLATSQRSVVGNVIPTVSRILGADFVGMIQRKMRDECYPKAAISGALPPEDKTIAFLVMTNNLDIANDYIKRIISTHLDDNNDLPSLFPFGHDATFVQNEIRLLESTFSAKTLELLNEGISVVFTQVLKPRIRPMLADAFRDIDYALSADDLAALQQDAGATGDAAANPNLHEDIVRARFDRAWGALTRPIKRILTERNFNRLLQEAVSYLSKSLERRIWSFYERVNALGAVRLERDVSGIVAAAVQGGRYGLRDAFARCSQMTLIVNMEEDEWEELEKAEDGDEEEGEGMAWALDVEERRRARAILGD